MSNQAAVSASHAVLEDASEVTVSHPQARFLSVDDTIVALCYDTCHFRASASKILIPGD